MSEDINLKTIFSLLLKERRNFLKLTQKELAAKVGLSSRQIGKIEDGTFLPNLKTYFKLCSVLNLNIENIKEIQKYSLRKEEIIILSLLKELSCDELNICLKIINAFKNEKIFEVTKNA